MADALKSAYGNKPSSLPNPVPDTNAMSPEDELAQFAAPHVNKPAANMAQQVNQFQDSQREPMDPRNPQNPLMQDPAAELAAAGGLSEDDSFDYQSDVMDLPSAEEFDSSQTGASMGERFKLALADLKGNQAKINLLDKMFIPKDFDPRRERKEDYVRVVDLNDMSKVYVRRNKRDKFKTIELPMGEGGTEEFIKDLTADAPREGLQTLAAVLLETPIGKYGKMAKLGALALSPGIAEEAANELAGLVGVDQRSSREVLRDSITEGGLNILGSGMMKGLGALKGKLTVGKQEIKSAAKLLPEKDFGLGLTVDALEEANDYITRDSAFLKVVNDEGKSIGTFLMPDQFDTTKEGIPLFQGIRKAFQAEDKVIALKKQQGEILAEGLEKFKQQYAKTLGDASGQNLAEKVSSIAKSITKDEGMELDRIRQIAQKQQLDVGGQRLEGGLLEASQNIRKGFLDKLGLYNAMFKDPQAAMGLEQLIVKPKLSAQEKAVKESALANLPFKPSSTNALMKEYANYAKASGEGLLTLQELNNMTNRWGAVGEMLLKNDPAAARLAFGMRSDMAALRDNAHINFLGQVDPRLARSYMTTMNKYGAVKEQMQSIVDIAEKGGQSLDALAQVIFDPKKKQNLMMIKDVLDRGANGPEAWENLRAAFLDKLINESVTKSNPFSTLNKNLFQLTQKVGNEPSVLDIVVPNIDERKALFSIARLGNAKELTQISNKSSTDEKQKVVDKILGIMSPFNNARARSAMGLFSMFSKDSALMKYASGEGIERYIASRKLPKHKVVQLMGMKADMRTIADAFEGTGRAQFRSGDLMRGVFEPATNMMVPPEEQPY